MANREFATVNISDCLEDKIEGFGEADLKRAVSTFSSIDPHVETFLKNSAEEFARQHKSVSYLVFSSGMAELLGYFTLAAKPITMELGKMSKTMERAVKKTGKLQQARRQNLLEGALSALAQRATISCLRPKAAI